MAKSKKINVLVVEDNKDHLFFIKKALSDKNYVLQNIVSGTEAYNYLLNPKIKPDIVLLDNHLPGMSGLEILKKLGSKKNDYGFIVTTVDENSDIVVDAMRAGALDFSPKTPGYFNILPHKINKVYDILKERLEKSQLQKDIKIKQKALEEAEELAKLGAFNLDLTTFKANCSKMFGKITGFDIKQPVDFYKDWRGVVHPDDVKGNKTALEQAIKTGKFNLTYRIKPKGSDKIKWLHGLGKITYKDNKATNFIGTIQDITERKIAQEVLVKNEQLYKSVFANSPLGIIHFNNKGIITDTNEELVRIVGSSYKKIVGLDMLNDFTDKKMIEAVKKTLAKGYGAYDGNYTPITSKKTTPLIGNFKAIRNTKNEIVGGVGLFEDVTERERYTEELRQSEERNTTILNNLKAGIVIHINNKIVYANNAILDMMGYDNEQSVIGKHIFDFVHPDEHNKVKNAINKSDANKNDSLVSFETRFVKADGSSIIVEDTALVINYYGEEARMVMVNDITERKQAENKLLSTKKAIEESERKFRDLFEKSGDATLIIKNGDFVDCNQAAVTQLKYKNKKELLNVHPSVLSPEFQPDGKTSLEKADKMMALAFKNGTHRFEWDHKKSTDEIFQVEVLLTTMTNNPNNKVIHAVWRDMTDRKLAEQALKNSEYLLRKSQEVAKIGSYNLDFSSSLWESSEVLNNIFGINNKTSKEVAEWMQVIHPEDREMMQEYLAVNIMTHHETFDKDYRIIRIDDQQERWVHGMGKLEFNTKGELLKMIGTIQDITEKKEAEIILKENKRELEEAENITQLGRFVFDDNTDMFESSPICDEIIGIDASFKKNIQGWVSLVHPDDYDKTQVFFDNNKITNISVEVRIIRPNNHKTIWVLGNIKKEFDSKGVRSKITGTIQDITERKLIEERLKQSDIILNKIDSLIQVIDANGNIIYSSPSVETLLGYKPEETLGQGWWRLTTSSTKEANYVRDAILNNVRKNTPLTNDLINRKIIDKNGVEKIFQWEASKGVNDSLIFVGLDITEKSERELQFKKITETAHSAIVLANDKGIIIECNSATESIFGYTKKEILGKSIQILIPEKYKQAHDSAFNAAIKSGDFKNIIAAKLEGVTKKGSIFPIELSLNNWQSNGHTVSCAYINDVSKPQREAKTKEVIFNITKKANETVGLDILFNFIKSELGKLINTTNFFIALYDEKTDMISTPYMVDEEDDNDDFPKGKTLTGYVIDTNKVLLANESVFKKLERAKKIERHGPSSKCWVGVPLLVNNKAIGAIVLQSYNDVNAYTLKDVALLELIALNISQVIKQSQGLEKIKLLNQALIQSPESVVVTNTKGEIEYVNPAFTTLSGYSEKEAFGKTPRILKSDEQTPEFYDDLWKTIADGNVWEGELINQHKDGSNYLVKANIAPVKNKKGEITHYIGVQEDITEKRKLERDFIHTFIDAQEQEKQSFGEDLHDGISQILAAEAMYIDVLMRLDKKDDKKITEFLAKIRELNLSATNDARNIAHGLMSKQLKEEGLLKAINHICIDLSNTRNISFSFKHKALKESDFNKDVKTNIFRIIQEISTNTIRHSLAKKASVELTRVHKNSLKLVIKDDGVGIDFDKMKRDNKGAGLKNIERRVTLLNGVLNLESAPNKGTKYTIVVPLKSVK